MDYREVERLSRIQAKINDLGKQIPSGISVNAKVGETTIRGECTRTERVPVDYTSDTLEISLNTKYLGEYLNSVGEGKGILSMKDSHTQLQFTIEGYDYDYKYILMPLRGR